jgi:hypothetical protein
MTPDLRSPLDRATDRIEALTAERDAAVRCLSAILEADERGQGTPFAEAMGRARDIVTSHRIEALTAERDAAVAALKAEGFVA